MTTTEPLVSIIIRTKNEERWITSCLRSVFQQTYTNIEVILVDNHSTDMTVKKSFLEGSIRMAFLSNIQTDFDEKDISVGKFNLPINVE